MKKVKFYDENTRQWWIPDTGAVNVPAVNDLIGVLGMAFGDTVLEGEFKLGRHPMYYASGTNIAKFPADGRVVAVDLKDQGKEVLDGAGVDVKNAAVLGLLDRTRSAARENEVAGEDNGGEAETSDRGASENHHVGRVALYGDSNCLDSSHMQKDCFWLLEALLDFANSGNLPSVLGDAAVGAATVLPASQDVRLPERMVGSHLHRCEEVFFFFFEIFSSFVLQGW